MTGASLVLSPLGVLPAYQRNGFGTQLVRHAIGAADVRGVPLVFVEGARRFYGTPGFDRADTAGFRSPSLRIPPLAFQVARLSQYEEWMTGTLVYSETFWTQDLLDAGPSGRRTASACATRPYPVSAISRPTAPEAGDSASGLSIPAHPTRVLRWLPFPSLGIRTER
jgi:hypothetical protein